MAKKQSDGLFQNFKLAVIITIILIVGGVAWSGISKWIEDSKEEARNNHLNEVLVACTNREDSDRCKSLQRKYDITFKYCKSILDSVEDQFKIVYFPDGTSTIEYHPIWHAVVWEGSSSTPPNTSNVLGNLSIYKECADHQE